MKIKFGAIFLIGILAILVLVSINVLTQTPRNIIQIQEEQEITEPSKTIIYVPAVDSEGNGAIGRFEVESLPGSGRTLANIDHILFFLDTQFSIQIAKTVAANVTGIDISKYNIIYDIDVGDNQTRAIEGPSAGAALTIATIAALENKTLDREVMITGTINPDGSIGRVGGIAAKAKVAKGAGAKVLLVPEGQGLRPSTKIETSCEQVGRLRVCRSEYKPQPTISTTAEGLIVKEVANINEALKYFLQ